MPRPKGLLIVFLAGTLGKEPETAVSREEAGPLRFMLIVMLSGRNISSDLRAPAESVVAICQGTSSTVPLDIVSADAAD